MNEISHTPDPPPPSVRRVFISYAREDVFWAKEHARILRAGGLEIFLDIDSLRAGDPWPDVLRQEVERADMVWLLWSKYSAHSDWVREEYEAALAKGPGCLRIDYCDFIPLPPELEHIQAERSIYWQPRVERLLREPTRSLPEKLRHPSVLLRPEYGIVPYVGRQELLNDVNCWCESTKPFSARLYTGPGGSGKTRFMIQACHRMRELGWDARLLDSNALNESFKTEPEILDKLMSSRQPRLMVLDYAEARREQLRALLDRGLQKTSGHPIRLVLLARSATDWWEELLRSRYEYRDLLGPDTLPIELPPLAPLPATRQEIFKSAQKAFSELLELNVSSTPLPSLSGDHFQHVLFLHFAAFAHVYCEVIEERNGLLDLILDHEQRYWNRMVEDLALPPSLHSSLQCAAALIMLVGGFSSVDELMEALTRIPDLAEAKRAERKLVAFLFRNLYSYDGMIEPLQPDLLGEYLVSKVFCNDRRFRLSWMDDANEDQIRSGLTVINRITNDNPDAEAWLFEILSADAEKLAQCVIEVAVRSGDPIGKVFSELLASSPNFELAYRLEPALPCKTVALRELALEVTSQALRYIENSKDIDSENIVNERARLLNNLGDCLRELGRWEQALHVQEEAVTIRRQLAEGNSDAFLPDLAGNLTNMGVILSKLGRREQALAAAEEAIKLYRQLAEVHPDAFMPDLAKSLSNLGVFFSDMGRYKQALVAHEESVAIDRHLAKARPDIFLPNLASSLCNLGGIFRELGWMWQALATVEEAVKTYRRMIEVVPDAFLPDLAASLDNLGILLSEHGQQEQAKHKTEEAVAIWLQLAKARPDAFLPNLAASLNNLGIIRGELGQREQALAAAEEAVKLYRQLAKTHPDAFLPSLAGSLGTLSLTLRMLNQRERAQTAVEESVAIYRNLTEVYQDVFLANLAGSLKILAVILAEMERRKQALAAAEEAVKLYRQLTEALPDAYLPSLAGSLKILAVILRDLGQQQQGLAAAEEAFVILRQLAEAHSEIFMSDPTLSESPENPLG